VPVFSGNPCPPEPERELFPPARSIFLATFSAVYSLTRKLVNLRIFKIDADSIRKAKATDPNITVEGLVDMRIFEKRASRAIQ